jgi:hypothetical protein
MSNPHGALGIKGKLNGKCASAGAWAPGVQFLGRLRYPLFRRTSGSFQVPDFSLCRPRAHGGISNAKDNPRQTAFRMR